MSECFRRLSFFISWYYKKSTPALGESTDKQTELKIILQHSISRVLHLLEGASRLTTEVIWFQKKLPTYQRKQLASIQPCPHLLLIDPVICSEIHQEITTYTYPSYYYWCRPFAECCSWSRKRCFNTTYWRSARITFQYWLPVGLLDRRSLSWPIFNGDRHEI